MLLIGFCGVWVHQLQIFQPFSYFAAFIFHSLGTRQKKIKAILEQYKLYHFHKNLCSFVGPIPKGRMLLIGFCGVWVHQLQIF